MQLSIHNSMTGTILERPLTFDLDFSGNIANYQAQFIATDQGPQRSQSLTKSEAKGLAEKLFEATVNAKVWTSYVSSRLDRGARDRFFRQLDRLHDIDEWVDDGKPLQLSSYKTFVRSILTLKLNECPGLALMSNGNLLGTWIRDGSKLSIEFQDDDRVRWVISEPTNGRIDRIAGDTGFDRLSDELRLRGAEKWFT